MLKDTITIINKLGLHARAAAVLAKTATRFESSIKVGFNSRLVDAKSVMALMLLAAAKGTVLDVEVSGSDATEAMDAIRQTILNRFGEDE
jgi:phosphocarrier protein